MSVNQDPPPPGLGIDGDTERRIEEYARAAGRRPADVVRMAFEEYERAPVAESDSNGLTAFDVPRRSGLIGCVTGGDPGAPDDLATNPAHREGFGSD